MRNTILGLFAAATLFSSAARGAEPSPAAQDRANLYQREFRAALTRHGWRITQDEAGKLTAEHHWAPHNGTTDFVRSDANGSTYARLQVDFQADGKNHTTTAARASLCIYSSPEIPQATYLVYPPLALRDPKLTQEYLDLSAEAESRLATSHRAYATATNGSKVAMK